jgi:hypothetical protein
VSTGLPGRRKKVASTHTCVACGEPVGVYLDTTMVPHHDGGWKPCVASHTSAHSGNPKHLTFNGHRMTVD